MVIIGRMSYPAESSKEVGKRFLEHSSPLDTITTMGPYVRRTFVEGIETIEVYELYRFDPSRYTEATDYLYKRYASYKGVPGLTYAFEQGVGPQDALKTIGTV